VVEEGNFVNFIIVAYITYVLTFVLGIIFFIRYDIRKKRLPPRLLALHFFLAVMTFIFFTSALAPQLKAHYTHPKVGSGVHSSNWLNLERHHHMLGQRFFAPPKGGSS
jgi:hypothetical protein